MEFIRKFNQGRDRLGCGSFGTGVAYVHITNDATELLRYFRRISQIPVNAFILFRPYSSPWP